MFTMRQIFFSLSTEYQNSYNLTFIYNSTIIVSISVTGKVQHIILTGLGIETFAEMVLEVKRLKNVMALVQLSK